MVIDEKIPVVETAGNKPDKFIRMFKDAGLIVIHKCVAIQHALSAIRYGADIIRYTGRRQLQGLCRVWAGYG